jgi:hypothetical protein
MNSAFRYFVAICTTVICLTHTAVAQTESPFEIDESFKTKISSYNGYVTTKITFPLIANIEDTRSPSLKIRVILSKTGFVNKKGEVPDDAIYIYQTQGQLDKFESLENQIFKSKNPFRVNKPGTYKATVVLFSMSSEGNVRIEALKQLKKGIVVAQYNKKLPKEKGGSLHKVR